MKKIEATINPTTLHTATQALHAAGIHRFSIVRLEAATAQPTPPQLFRGFLPDIDTARLVRIELTADHATVELARDTFLRVMKQENASTGTLLVMPVDSSVDLGSMQSTAVKESVSPLRQVA